MAQLLMVPSDDGGYALTDVIVPGHGRVAIRNRDKALFYQGSPPIPEDQKVIAAIRRYVETERRAVKGAMAEAPEYHAGRGAALLSVSQWLDYVERTRA